MKQTNTLEEIVYETEWHGKIWKIYTQNSLFYAVWYFKNTSPMRYSQWRVYKKLGTAKKKLEAFINQWFENISYTQTKDF